MEALVGLLVKAKEYIEEAEVVIDGEWDCRTLNQLIGSHKMPGTYWDILAAIQANVADPRSLPSPAGGSSLPRINIRCECHDGKIRGTTYLKVVRVEQEDDGSFTAVTDHWPNYEVDDQMGE